LKAWSRSGERDPYRPGERLWVKHKDGAAPRFDERGGISRCQGAKSRERLPVRL